MNTLSLFKDYLQIWRSSLDKHWPSGLAAAATPSLTYDFAYMCLKNAESLLPASEQVQSY